ncbi:MAG: hypothetical protein DWI26_00265 [Planctomycetota bacterium]|nr:MAG: hypothetical protein DWI26_00265 [Planctomycetota bacterium]
MKAWKSLLIEEMNARVVDLPQRSWLFGFSPEGWHIQLGNDRLWLIKSCVSALRASRTLLCT